MQGTETKQIKEKGFIKLQDLTKDDVKKLPLLNVRLKRQLNKSGLATNATLMVNPLNLQISMVSSEMLPNGKSRQLRYFLPDVFIALIMELNLPQIDENNKDKNDWVVPAAIRFVKGKYRNSESEFHSIEVVFKQFKYHTHFLTPHQLKILETLASQKKLVDRSGKVIKLEWLERPDAIEEAESQEDFMFN